mmetsp:Transcript_9701/g.27077  ORF Transcript_9701/g.27077 Transcript_9701/m.27077 type:complete len:299 (-) Transcript_9701:1572-2468(-)
MSSNLPSTSLPHACSDASLTRTSEVSMLSERSRNVSRRIRASSLASIRAVFEHSCTNRSASAAAATLASAAAPMPCVARTVATSAGVGTTVRIARNASRVTPVSASEPVVRTSRIDDGSALGCAPRTMAILLAVLAGRHDDFPASPAAVAPRMAPARCLRFSSRAFAASSRAATSISPGRGAKGSGLGSDRTGFDFEDFPVAPVAAFDRSARSRRPAPPAVTARLDDSASLADVGESESDEWYPCFRSAAARSAASRSSATSLAARSPRRPPAAATRAEASAPARRRSRRLASPGVVF